jgi:phosphoserine aminotransferase
MPLPWDRLDVSSFSFQKALGGEAGLGALILSPRAVERLNQYSPPWPLPKILRFCKGGCADEAILNGDAVNTFSFMVIEDYVQALNWAQTEGGLDGLIKRTNANFQTISHHLQNSHRFGFCALDVHTRSTTSVCLTFKDQALIGSPPEIQRALSKAMAALLAQKDVGYDLESYRQAPPGLRIWCGPTVEQTDLKALMPWLDWAYDEALSNH